ncbi:hypothetical protein BDQ17DRAFT_1341427 [Cyathus striatus]|nr:hypothetical protein BDQ17DRAFT_1341427 [Cyathus striatus]
MSLTIESQPDPFCIHRYSPIGCLDKDALVLNSSSEETLINRLDRVERLLGETETSYFLPSRQSGVNDMYLHIGCSAPLHLVQRSRVRLVWAILRLRHPLLASQVEMEDYDDIKFIHTIPDTADTVLSDADATLEYRSQSKDDLIYSYLNGPRTLSNQRLSYLVVAQQNASYPSKLTDSHFLICATHFLGDGMALHQFANDMFTLLGSTSTETDLLNLLYEGWSDRYLKSEHKFQLPSAMEDRFPPLPPNKWSRIISSIDFKESQRKLIGGHAFPRAVKAERRTVIHTISFDTQKTKQVLAKCKLHGVSISSALFSVCNVAWTRTKRTGLELPMMMYSALNMRPYLDSCAASDSYWFLAVGYFNVILPAFLPADGGDTSRTFWHRARLAKAQSARAAKNPMVISRSREMARERADRARGWAKEDDHPKVGKEHSEKVSPVPTATPTIPSSALLGLSLLGNLDGIYKHAKYPDIHLHTLTTGSRQRSGGMLMFAYTFVGKLWVSFGFDKNGFDEEIVSKFWDNVLVVMDEMFL